MLSPLLRLSSLAALGGRILLLTSLGLALTACNDSSSVSSGGGELSGDGGDPSAKFAGTYRGQAAFQYSGTGVDGQSDLKPIVIVVNRNGTVSTTVADTTVGGVINNNKVQIKLKIDRTQDGISCDATVDLTGTVTDRRLSGPITGSGDCKILGISRKVTLSGSFSSSKR